MAPGPFDRFFDPNTIEGKVGNWLHSDVFDDDEGNEEYLGKKRRRQEPPDPIEPIEPGWLPPMAPSPILPLAPPVVLEKIFDQHTNEEPYRIDPYDSKNGELYTDTTQLDLFDTDCHECGFHFGGWVLVKELPHPTCVHCGSRNTLVAYFRWIEIKARLEEWARRRRGPR